MVKTWIKSDAIVAVEDKGTHREIHLVSGLTLASAQTYEVILRHFCLTDEAGGTHERSY